MSNTPHAPVIVTFDCIPLRSVRQSDIPADASPAYRRRLERVRKAAERHGSRNAYYLLNGSCRFHFTNDPAVGWVQFGIDGTVLTDASDTRTVGSDLTVELDKETCDWLTEPAVHWLAISARQAVEKEFDRYIAAGDLARTRDRLEKEQAASDSSGGFLGMNL